MLFQNGSTLIFVELLHAQRNLFERKKLGTRFVNTQFLLRFFVEMIDQNELELIAWIR